MGVRLTPCVPACQAGVLLHTFILSFMTCSLRSADGRARRFLPFMEGPRSCAGQALAVMNLTAALAMLYGSFTFRLAEEVRESVTMSALHL